MAACRFFAAEAGSSDAPLVCYHEGIDRIRGLGFCGFPKIGTHKKVPRILGNPHRGGCQYCGSYLGTLNSRGRV